MLILSFITLVAANTMFRTDPKDPSRLISGYVSVPIMCLKCSSSIHSQCANPVEDNYYKSSASTTKTVSKGIIAKCDPPLKSCGSTHGVS